MGPAPDPCACVSATTGLLHQRQAKLLGQGVAVDCYTAEQPVGQAGETLLQQPLLLQSLVLDEEQGLGARVCHKLTVPLGQCDAGQAFVGDVFLVEGHHVALAEEHRQCVRIVQRADEHMVCTGDRRHVGSFGEKCGSDAKLARRLAQVHA